MRSGRGRRAWVALATVGALLLWAAGLAEAQRGGLALRRYDRHGIRFDLPATWRVVEHADGELTTLWIGEGSRTALGARLAIHPAQNGAANGEAPRLADVVEAFRREQILKGQVASFAETPIIRKLLGGPAPGRQLRYDVRGTAHLAEGYVVRRGRRSFVLWLLFPQAESAAAIRQLGVIADSFYAVENPPPRSTQVPLAERRSYVGHGVAFQYPAGWTVTEQEDDASVTITVDEGPTTSPFLRLLLLKGEHNPRLYDAMAHFRAEVQARHGQTKFNVRTTARALNGERADGAVAQYTLGSQPFVTEVYLVQSGRRAVVVTLHSSSTERNLGAPAFDLFAQTLLVGTWPTR